MIWALICTTCCALARKLLDWADRSLQHCKGYDTAMRAMICEPLDATEGWMNMDKATGQMYLSRVYPERDDRIITGYSTQEGT